MDYIIEGTEKELEPGIIQYRRSVDFALVTQFESAYTTTDIIIETHSGKYTLNSAGFRTEKLRNCINGIIKPFKILKGWEKVKVGFKEFDFEDNMRVWKNYRVTYPREKTVFDSKEEYDQRNDPKRLEVVFTSTEAHNGWKDREKVIQKREEEERRFKENRAVRQLKSKRSKEKDVRGACMVKILELLEEE